MSQQLWTDVESYLRSLLAPMDEFLQHTLEASTEAGLPEIQVSSSQAKLLALLAHLQGAQSILEIGTLGGFSTIWLARALPEDGRLVTLEADSRYADVARANLEAAGLGEIVDVRTGPALDTLPILAEEGLDPFDFVFIDADKPNTPDYFSWAVRLSRRGGLIFVDNVVRQGELIDEDSEDPSVQGMRRLIEQVAVDPRVDATAIQTVSEKGHDGFVLARVVGDSGQ